RLRRCPQTGHTELINGHPGIPHAQNKWPAPVPLKSLGSCLECHDGTPADPNTFVTPATHALAV
ncbi:hypothetical protein AB0F02_38940, partial [Streptomyces sp. NPDC029554]